MADLRKGDKIGPFRFGGDMDTGEGDPFGLRESVFDTLLEDTARQMREQGQCAAIEANQVGDPDICMLQRPCPIHEPPQPSPAAQLTFFDRFVRWWGRA